jgi:hypothetical protein
MSLPKSKILVSGCGFSWGGQERKTWVNVLKSVGINVDDVSGPAVSNQWIINKAFTQLLTDSSYNHVVIQLTAPGKLDVEVDDIRVEQLVKTDSIRNFVVDGVWPSSLSSEHESKQQYYKWLYSPRLEIEDLYVKLMMLAHWCITKKISLTILQAYSLCWTDQQKQELASIVKFMDDPLYNQYTQSDHYKLHDVSNSVPCLSYQADLAFQLSEMLSLGCSDKIVKIKQFYN